MDVRREELSSPTVTSSKLITTTKTDTEEKSVLQPNHEESQVDGSNQNIAADTINRAAEGLSAHLIYQVSARLFSFIIKAVVIRALGPSQLAFVEIRLVLLVTLGLLPAISGFRPITLRLESESRACALAYFQVIVTAVLGIILGSIAIVLDPKNRLALFIILLSVFVRGFSELPVLFSRRRLQYKEASRSRAISIVISGVTQTIAVSTVSQKFAGAASSTSHLSYVLALGITMYFGLGSEGLPKELNFKHMLKHLKKDDIILVFITTGEGFIKFLLENGEAIILDVFTNDQIKGAYKIAANLGSVFARFFSEALEEQAFNVFSKLSNSFHTPLSISALNGNPNIIYKPESDLRLLPIEDQNIIQRRKTCLDMLTLGLKAAITVSLVFALVGRPFSYSLLRLLYGAQWAEKTTAPFILANYLIYVVFMAANGVSEAFVTASASRTELKQRTKFTTCLSIIYIASLIQAAKWYNAHGIILVNCLNMLCRTFYSVWFFNKFTHLSIYQSYIFKVLPHYGVILTLIFSNLIATQSESWFLGYDHIFDTHYDMFFKIACHAISGFVSLFLFILSVWILERDFVMRIRSLRPS